MDYDLAATIIIHVGVEELKDRLEAATKDMKYIDAKDGCVSFIERKRGSSAIGLIPMDIGRDEETTPTVVAEDRAGHGESMTIRARFPKPMSGVERTLRPKGVPDAGVMVEGADQLWAIGTRLLWGKGSREKRVVRRISR